MMKADKHILPAFGACQVTGLTLDDVYAFIRQKQEAGLSNRYISDILVLMKSVFRYGVMRYRMYHNNGSSLGLLTRLLFS